MDLVRFVLAWVAGLVALVAATVWGTKLGVQFSITFLALKALPDSIYVLAASPRYPARSWAGSSSALARSWPRLISAPPWAAASIPGWLRAGAGRADGPATGPVRRTHHRAGVALFYREAGQSRPATPPTRRSSRYAGSHRVLLLAFASSASRCSPVHVWPFGSEYLLRAILVPFLILSLAAIGLNILTGYCGQLSLGSGAFMAVGAYSAYKSAPALKFFSATAMPMLLLILLGGLMAASLALCSAFQVLRIKGLYLAVATLASQFFFDWVFARIRWFTNYTPSGSVMRRSSNSSVGSSIRRSSVTFHVALRGRVCIPCQESGAWQLGRQWMAIRDMDIAAELIGIRPLYAKLSAFAISSFIIGVAGALWAFVDLGSWDRSRSTSTARSRFCSWSSSAASARSSALSSEQPSFWRCRSCSIRCRSARHPDLGRDRFAAGLHRHRGADLLAVDRRTSWFCKALADRQGKAQTLAIPLSKA